MKKFKSRYTNLCSKIALIGIICGIVLFLVSFTIPHNYYHSLTFFLGIYTVEASMIIFGVGLLLGILTELTERSHKK